MLPTGHIKITTLKWSWEGEKSQLLQYRHWNQNKLLVTDSIYSEVNKALTTPVYWVLPPLQDAQGTPGVLINTQLTLPPTCRNTTFFSQKGNWGTTLHCVFVQFCSFHDALSSPRDNPYHQESSTLFIQHTAHSWSLSCTFTKSHKVLMGNLDLVSTPVLHHNHLSRTRSNSSTLSGERTWESLAPSNELTAKF